VGTHTPLLTYQLEGNSVSGSIAQRTVRLSIKVTKPTFSLTIPPIKSSGLFAIDKLDMNQTNDPSAVSRTPSDKCNICGTIGFELVGGDTDYLKLEGSVLIL
jgi:hypothetical protein